MSDDIQMEVEENQPAVAQVPAHHQESIPSNPFFQWNTPSDFGIPSQNSAMNGQPTNTMSGFGHAMIPPGVSASNGCQDETSLGPDGNGDKIPAKMHVRRPGRDNWSYIGRVGIFQELTHKAPIVASAMLFPYLKRKATLVTDNAMRRNATTTVIRLQNNDKVIATFTENSNISVDKRGNFIVVASVEPAGVISYSLHAQSNNDALRLLASIELAAYKLGTVTGTENRQQSKLRRKIDRTIKEDRRRRHRRRKDDDALVAMLGNAKLDGTTVQ